MHAPRAAGLHLSSFRSLPAFRSLAVAALAAGLTLFRPATVPAAATVPIDLVGHKAQYDLVLANAHGDVTAASGTMSYEVVDSCDGWAVHQRLAMTLTNRDGQDIDMLSEYTTWESKDGRRLRYRMRQTTDQAVTSDVSGEAELDPATGGSAAYTQPEGTTRKLAKGTLFPMAHTAAILQAAMAGKKFITLPLFDGTGTDGAQDSTVAIIDWKDPAPGPWAPLASLPSGRVHIAFFDQGPSTTQPDYEVSMRYWSNGVADDLLMDFGEFSMRGKLTKLVMQPKGC